MKLFMCMHVTKSLLLRNFEKFWTWITIYCILKNLSSIVELYFCQIFMPMKFELMLISRTIGINHACYSMASFVIFIFG